MNDLADATYSAAQTLLRTIDKIEGLDPLVGPKWKAGMLRHYYETLASLTLERLGIDDATEANISTLTADLRRLRWSSHPLSYDRAYRLLLESFVQGSPVDSQLPPSTTS